MFCFGDEGPEIKIEGYELVREEVVGAHRIPFLVGAHERLERRARLLTIKAGLERYILVIGSCINPKVEGVVDDRCEYTRGRVYMFRKLD